MFIDIDELKSAVYRYQIDQITESDDDIVYMAISAAEDEVKSYLRPNKKKKWQDGRPLYDVDAIFGATGTNRNALLMELTKTIAVYYLIRLCNVDMLYESTKERYDRAVKFLQPVQDGEKTLDLPLLTESTDITTPGVQLPFRYGSRPKFNHDY